MTNSGTLSILISYKEYIWQCQFPRLSQQCFVILTKRNHKLMVQDIAILLNQYWWGRLHIKEHKISMMEFGYTWFMIAVPRNGSNIAKMKTGIYFISELFRDTLWYPTSPELMRYSPIPYDWKQYIYLRGCSWVLSGIVLGGKEKDKARQGVFLTPLNSFGKDPEEEKPHCYYAVPQKVPYEIFRKHNQNAVNWVRLSKAQDQGLEIWQTKSFAIMTYATIPGDCIDCVTAQNGDWVIFQRLATPRLAPKFTLKENWESQKQQHEQQPQQPIPHTDVPRLWKQKTTWETQAEVQDDSKHITETDLPEGNWMLTTSKVDWDTHLGDKKVSTNAFLHDEANTQAIELVKIGSNNTCIREDLAKEKMVFSHESSQAISEMGNVELSELKTSMIQSPSCLHHFFKRDNSLPMR